MSVDSGLPIALPSCRFEGREAFSQLVRDALESAAQQNWAEIVLCDITFEGWPLEERVVAESLAKWSKTGRRFVMLASNYDTVLRQHARFVSWRKRWGHIIDCRVCRNLDRTDFPSAIWSPAWALRRLDVTHSTGVCGSEPDRRVKIREMLDELLLTSSPGFAASVLGL